MKETSSKTARGPTSLRASSAHESKAAEERRETWTCTRRRRKRPSLHARAVAYTAESATIRFARTQQRDEQSVRQDGGECHVDDEEVEDNRHKATLRMIAKVGLRSLQGTPGEYEIFALNSRDRSMPPTEINGASRRILALSFVLGLCKVSRTLAPLVADSLLNFMSGSVRTNTLGVTAETASQPILLLTGSDLESQTRLTWWRATRVRLIR